MRHSIRGGRRAAKREEGVVLALVMILALLLSASIVTFSRRAVVDTMIVKNREDAARAEALARGGLRLAEVLLVEDKLAKQLLALNPPDLRPVTPGNTSDDLWNHLKDFELVDAEGGRLRLEVQDAGGLLNLNAVVPYTGQSDRVDPDAEQFLVEVLTKVIDEMPVDPAEKVYDPRELARNLIDYMDLDDRRVVGGSEDDYYLGLDPPHRAANRPLLSVEEIGLVEGFDVQLMNAMKSYVTVYPLVDAAGINLNTAPPHVLALVYHGVGGERRLASADTVQRILALRDEDLVVCNGGPGSIKGEGCVSLIDVDLGEGSIFPAATLPDQSDSFTVKVRATVGEIERTIVAVIDRSELTDPQLLFWRMQ